MKEGLDVEKLNVLLLNRVVIHELDDELLEKRGIIVDEAHFLLGDDGKPQWEYTEIEAINYHLSGTPWLYDPASKEWYFESRLQNLHKERKILLLTLVRHFIVHPGNFVRWEIIQKETWPEKHKYTVADVNTHKSKLCAELDDHAILWIHSKGNKGYMFYSPSTSKQ